MGTVTSGPWNVRCSAASKRTGSPCLNMAVKGATVCRMHGAGGSADKPGAAARAKSNRERIEDRIKELGDQAVSTLQRVLDDDTVKPEVRVRAAETVLDRIVGKKIEAEVHNAEVADLDAEIEAELGVLPEPVEDTA